MTPWKAVRVMTSCAGGEGSDTLDGGSAGETNGDTADYSTHLRSITVDLDTGGGNGTATDTTSDVDTLTNIENVIGSNQNDDITGDDNANTLSGGADADTLRGEGGNDTLNGDAGDDILFGGAGTDSFNGGADVDTVSYDGVSQDVTANLDTGIGNDGTGGADTYTDVENVIGGSGDDTLTGTDSTTVGNAPDRRRGG